VPQPFGWKGLPYVGKSISSSRRTLPRTITAFLPTGGRIARALFQPGNPANVGDCVVSTVGPVSNTGSALRVYGGQRRLMGQGGGDDFGRVVPEENGAMGAAPTASVGPPAGRTSYTVVLAVAATTGSFCPIRRRTTASRGRPNYETMVIARAFHFGYPTLMHGFFADGGAS